MSTETLERPSTTVEVVTVRHVEITDEHVQNIIDIAGYWMTYWAASAPREAWKEGDAFVFVEVGDGDDEVTHHLTGEQIRQAWAEIAAGDHSAISNEILAQFAEALDAGEPDLIDAEAADVLVQIAALGKVVYG
ncbi:hypothetical protein ABRQ22_14840 [Cellulosimicrobium sp. ES-005]|uniref:Uncharacterized protein n=1 Tax=Cellulosimicrobium sp. ES-005 TaxID=3163031 RepID=A0AAU8FY47_9MICO